MKDTIVTLSRAELFDLVWTKPVSRLAEEFAISGVGLAKLCARRDIPTPPRGFWAQVEAGQSPPKPKLLASRNDAPIQLVKRSARSPGSAPTEMEASIAEAKQPENRIEVSEHLRAPHELVSRTRDLLRDAKRADNGFLERPKGCLNVHVTPKLVGRALRISDALLKACLERGWGASISGDRTVVAVNDIPITFAIAESLEAVEVPPGEERGSYTFRYNRPATSRRPGGQLLITIDTTENVWSTGTQRVWRESDKRTLESRLTSVLVGMMRLAAAVRAKLEDRELQQREENARKEAQERAREERQRLRVAIKKEQSRVTTLLDQSSRWRSSRTLRRFIAAAQQHGVVPESGEEHQDGLREWLAWASQQADRLDPFMQSPPSVLDRTEEAEEPATQGWGYR